ncbi:CheY-like chemotaxis protein [Rhodopseudomonas julia]|uniref:CheY-like chemotaxis protein n=1 Tax=Rhodopseudomonas julia TaxID=200617 RepID=A0ABU0C7M5_9BRAD|nr:response regulator [Rhodopseudomonas julia]MDQ0326523.1 CheY-like chemotaxis protein [Rhodopseudomonas julia]
MNFRVLYVDDEPDIREVAALSLELDDTFTVRTCSSGTEALAEAPKFEPHLILLDVMMPGMDGPETLRQLKADPRTADVPIVFVTAKTQTTEIARFMAIGAAGVIRKPFDPMTLAEQARDFLS